jgi:hypothetical protein
MRAVLRHNGLTSYDGKLRYSDEEHAAYYQQATDVGKNELLIGNFKGGAAHSMSGRIEFSTDGAPYISRAMATLDWKNIRDKQRWLASASGLEFGDVAALQTLMHEELHGASPIRDGIFRAGKIGIEEGMTELMARNLTRKLIGGAKHSEFFDMPKWSGKGPKGPEYKVEGNYATFQKAFLRESFNSLSKHKQGLKPNQIMDEVYAAITKLKRPPPAESRMVDDMEDYVHDYLVALGVPKDEARKEAKRWMKEQDFDDANA